jgi:hypothetical protein
LDNLSLPTYFVALLHRLEGGELVGDGVGVRLYERQLVLVLTRYFPSGRPQYITKFTFGYKKIYLINSWPEETPPILLLLVDYLLFPVLWIRIGFNADPNTTFWVNADPEPWIP